MRTPYQASPPSESESWHLGMEMVRQTAELQGLRQDVRWVGAVIEELQLDVRSLPAQMALQLQAMHHDEQRGSLLAYLGFSWKEVLWLALLIGGALGLTIFGHPINELLPK